MGTSERTYITLDNQTVLEAARNDPVGFIQGLDQAIIDEVQRAPDLLLAIKKSVDEDYRPGRFLLTGSANVLTLPKVADSLAGRMETIQMLPLARAEIAGSSPSFLEGLFEGKLKNQPNAVVGDDLVQLVLLGGFPEALSRESERRCQDWARSYLTSILTRDLRDIADVEKLAELPKFVRLLRLCHEVLRGDGIGVEGRNLSHKIVLLLAGVASRSVVDDVRVIAKIVRVAHRGFDTLALREAGEVDFEDPVVAKIAVERCAHENAAATAALAYDEFLFGGFEAREELCLLAQE